jgi:hypothetical protein
MSTQQQGLDRSLDLIPAQIPLFKATQYFANVLELASVIVALFYEQLPSQSFRLTSGKYVRNLLPDVSELSFVTLWHKQYSDKEHSLFWQTVYDYIQARTHSDFQTQAVQLKIDQYLQQVIANANGDATFPVIADLQLLLIEDYADETSLLRQNLTFDELVSLLGFLHGFSSTLADILSFQIPKLSFSWPVGLGWNIDIDAIVDIMLPSTPNKFLTWSVQDRGASLYLHFDSITLDDSTGIAVVNPANKNHGEERHPFGGSIGDLVFSGVKIELVINGQLADADKEPVAPYHYLRQAYFTERDHQNIVDIRLRVDTVSLGLNHTVLSALFSVINWVIDAFTNFDDLKEKLEDFIHDGIESLDDFGDIGNQIDKAIFAPILPGATTLKTQDFFKPFVKQHAAFSYDHLHIEGSGRGIHILNEAAAPPDFPDNDGGSHLPPTDGVPDPPIYDHADPLPDSAGTVNSPFDYLIPTLERRTAMKTQLDATSSLRADQEAAARLWLDGFSPKSMCWLRNRNIDAMAGTVYGKLASAKTIASLDRFTTGAAPQPNSFVFSSAAARPAAGSMLSLAASPFKDNQGIDLHPTPTPIPPPIFYAKDSTLAASKGSVIDPFWAGISINAIAMQKICDALNGSDFLVQSGTVKDLGSDLPYHIEPLAVPSFFIDLTGEKDHRPIANISHLVIRLGDPWTATYLLEISCPMQIVKPAPGCLPDDTLATIAFNRSCIEDLTGGKFTDQAYLDILYRYFYCLQFVSDEAKVTTSTLTHGSPIHPLPAQQDPTPKPGGPGGVVPDPTKDLPSPTLPVITDSTLLTAAMRSTLSQVFPIPAVFDPYYAQAPTLQSYEAKGGWLNIYETYQGLST